jgi:hypothetical protein
VITAAKASTITDQIDDITVPTKGAAAMVKSGSPATDFGLGGWESFAFAFSATRAPARWGKL